MDSDIKADALEVADEEEVNNLDVNDDDPEFAEDEAKDEEADDAGFEDDDADADADFDDADFEDDDPDFGDDDENDGFGSDDEAADDDDWGDINEFDPQEQVLHRTMSAHENMDEDEKEKLKLDKTLERQQSLNLFWKCMQCEFLNHPTNLYCMSCKKHRNAYNCLQIAPKMVEHVNNDGSMELRPSEDDFQICSSSESVVRTAILVNGYLREEQECASSSAFISDMGNTYVFGDIKVLILLFIPNFYALGIGKNACGELGVGNSERIVKYQKLHHLSVLMSADPTQDVYLGHCRFFIRTINDEVYVCGKNDMGMCGVPNARSGTNIVSFSKIKFDLENKNTAIAMSNNRGQNTSADNNNNNNNHNNSSNHRENSTPITVAHLSDGYYASHCLIHCSDNSIFGIGVGDDAQFGDNDIPELAEDFAPMPLQNLQLFCAKTPIEKIQCGDKHTLFLTAVGEVYACGSNDNGQCGIFDAAAVADNTGRTKQEPLLFTPTKVRNIPPMQDIRCGYMHTLCLSRDYGKLFVFGDSRYGQLGLGEPSTVREPLLHEFFLDKELTSIAVGLRNTAVIDIDGLCYIFGRNDFFQIGSALGKNVHEPHTFQSEGYDSIIVSEISLGAFHTVLLTDTNDVMSFGKNNCGQCSSALYADAIPNVTAPYLVERKEMGLTENDHIAKVYAGYETTIIVVDIRCTNVKQALRVFNAMDYDQTF